MNQNNGIDLSKNEAQPQGGVIDLGKNEAQPQGGAIDLSKNEAQPQGGVIDLGKNEAQPQGGTIDLGKNEAQPVQQAAPQQPVMNQNVQPQQAAFNQQATFNQNVQQGQPNQNGNATPPVYNINNFNIVQEKSTKAGIGLACAIAGLLFGCCGMGGLFAVIGVIFGILSMKNKEPKSGMAVAALIISAIAIIINICVFAAVKIPMVLGYIEA